MNQRHRLGSYAVAGAAVTFCLLTASAKAHDMAMMPEHMHMTQPRTLIQGDKDKADAVVRAAI
jgi:hypothetical protein